MALLAKVVNFNIGTGAVASTVTVAHGLGDTPKAVIFLWSGRTETVDARGNASYQRGMGWSIGDAGNYAVASAGANGATAGTDNYASRRASATGCCLAVTPAGVGAGKADIQSWDATNLVFEILEQFGADLRITALVLGGDAIRHVAVGKSAVPATGSPPFTQDITGLSFTPLGAGRTLALFMAAGDTCDFDDTIVDDSGFTVGAATSDAQRGVIYSGEDDLANPSVLRSYSYPGECLALTRGSAGALVCRADFNGWLAAGYQLEHLEISNATVPFAYLIIDGPKAAVLQGTTSTTGGADIALTGAGFQPEAGVVFSVHGAQNTQDTPTAAFGPSLGVWDGTNQAAHSAEATNNVTTTVHRTAVEHDNVYVGVTSAGALDTLMAWQSNDADGVTFDMTDGDSGARQFHAILLATAPPATTSTTPSPVRPVGVTRLGASAALVTPVQIRRIG